MDISNCGASSESRLKSRLTVGLWTSSPEIVLVAMEYIRHDIWGRVLIDEIGDEAFKRLCAKSPMLAYLLNSR